VGKPRASHATVGKLIIVLNKARDADAMSEAEYVKEKQRLLQ
jgi:hypothetical protein